MKVYGASKLHHAPMWQELRTSWPEIEWTARWPVEHCGQTPDEAKYATWFWMQDHEDVQRADVVLVYAEPEDVLRGALVEAGMCLAFKKTVICVGENVGFGTWQYHPLVTRLPTMTSARQMLNFWRTQDASKQ